jgi:hypothetical protein
MKMSAKANVTKLIAQFEGREIDQQIRLSIFDTHVEISVEEAPPSVVIKIPIEELGSIYESEILGMMALIIEDNGGIVVTALRMDPSEARRAADVLNRLKTSEK